MASLEKSDIRAWQVDKVESGLAHATLMKAYSSLKTMLKRAVEEDEVLSANPLEKVRLLPPNHKEQKENYSAERNKKRRMFSNKELACIQTGLELYSEKLREQRRNSRAHGKSHLPDLDIISFPHWFIPFCHLALYSGLRPGDIRALEWGHLDLTFNPHIDKVPEKTMHNPNPARIIMSLQSDILSILKLWQAQTSCTGFVFPSDKADYLGKKLTKKAYIRHWKKILKLGGIDYPLDFYSIRHHFISELVADGIPLLSIAHLVGHKSTSMIEQHYGHLCPDAAIDIMATHEKKLKGTPSLKYKDKEK